MPKGEQRIILTPGVNKRINAFITILWPSKKVIYSVCRRRRSREFKRHLRNVLRRMRSHKMRRIILILDNATSHHSRETRRFLDKHSDAIGPFYLPKHSPQLNEVEGRVNRKLKRDVCTNHAYESVEEIERAARRYLRMQNRCYDQTDLT
jgi:transposase